MGVSSINKIPYGLPCSLAVQWLRLCAFTEEGMGSITDWGTKIAHEGWWGWWGRQ